MFDLSRPGLGLNPQRVYRGLLGHNFLPMQKKDLSEMPPTWSSDTFTPEIADQFDDPKLHPVRKLGYDGVDYGLTRFDSARRNCAIPHPAAYARLARALSDAWTQVEETANNESSRIRPMDHADGRVFVMDYESVYEQTSRSLALGFGKRFTVHADISTCYPSLYTHAIPWALLGHEGAKEGLKDKSKRTPLYETADNIDRRARESTRGETHGVPIGPGTSSLLAEIILSRVDEVLEYDHSRFVDDYTASFETEEQAQRFLRTLSTELGRYNFQLNHRKTRVAPVNVSLRGRWVDELNLMFPESEALEPADAIRFLSYAAQLASDHKTASVLKYAVKLCMGKVPTGSVGFDLYVDYLLNICFHFHHIIPTIGTSGPEIRSALAEKKEKLSRIIEVACESARSDAIAWTLHLMQTSGVVPNDRVFDVVVESGDCIGIAMLSGWDEGAVRAAAFARDLPDYPYDLDKYWILRYQLYYMGAIGSKDLHSDEQPTFDFLKSSRVSFLSIPDVSSEL